MQLWPLFGESASLLAALIWAVSMSLYTRYGQGINPRHLNLFKNSFAIVCLVLVTSLLGWNWPQGSMSYGVLAFSGIIGLAVGDTLLFKALHTIGAQRTSVIQCLAPPFAALIAFLCFGEVLNVWEWAGLSLTVFFLATLLLARGGTVHRPMNFIGLASALGAAACQALAMTSLRWSLQGLDVWTGTFLRMAPSICGLLLYAAYRGDVGEMRQIFQPRRRVVFLTVAAFFGTFLGLVLMSVGAKYTKAGVATALSATTPIWILPVAHFMLEERVNLKVVILTTGAVLGVALMILGPRIS